MKRVEASQRETEGALSDGRFGQRQQLIENRQVTMERAVKQVEAARASKDKANLCVACTNAAKAMLAAEQRGPKIEALYREGIECARKKIARFYDMPSDGDTTRQEENHTKQLLTALNSFASLLYQELQCTFEDEKLMYQKCLEVEALHQEALELATRIGDTTNSILVLSNLANYWESGVHGFPMTIDREAAAQYRIQLQACMQKTGRNDMADECPICLESLNVFEATTNEESAIMVMTDCHHVMHRKCHDENQANVQILELMKSCPVI